MSRVSSPSSTAEPLPGNRKTGCPVCGSQQYQAVVLPCFHGEAYGHHWCRKCGATYDSNIDEVQQIALDEQTVRGVQSQQDYRKLFVETWEIANQSGDVYPAFQWKDNQALREGVARHVLQSIERYVTQPKPLKILDVGCGSGFTTEILARHYGTENVIGLDPSPMVEEMSRRTKIPGIRGTLDSVRFDDEQFDVVVILGNIMLHPDVRKTLTEATRVVKRQGVLIFDFKNIRSLSRQLSILLARTSRRFAANGFIQRNFVNMRFGLARSHLRYLLPDPLELLETFDKPPRLLEFENKSSFQSGLKGFVWRSLNGLDRVRGEQAWIQCVARKS